MLLNFPPVRLLNPSTSEIKLYKGMYIGSFIPTKDPKIRQVKVVATVSSNPSHDWAHTLLQSSALTGQQEKQVEQLRTQKCIWQD